MSVPLGGTRHAALKAEGMLEDHSPAADARRGGLEAIEHLDDGPVLVPGESNRRWFEKVTSYPGAGTRRRRWPHSYGAIGKPE